MDKRRISFPRTNTRILARALSAGFAVGVIGIGAAIANPVGPQVVSGTASINQSGSTLTVTNSNGAILNWQQFNIGAGETTRFIQPSASSAVMNRVLASDPSLIYGTLSSNGKVWLVNPAGILVGPGANINVASFVASTLNISNQDFLAGRLNAIATPGAGNLVNQGRITTPSGGSVYLIGANVSNEGLITTPQGDTILAAGNSVQLLDTGTPGVKVEISGSEGNATNLGQIVADAGRIGIAGILVRNSGQLNASSAIAEGGRIFLRASKDAYVDGAGRIITTGSQGGRVEVLGERVAVTDQASIDASGRQGGGTILVGGDYQGKNPEVANASVSYFGADASLRADATDNGNGGKVVVWADDTTRALGSISARGGENGGNGGLIETSGKRMLDVDGIKVKTTAPSGRVGTWLLDPQNFCIYGSAICGDQAYDSFMSSTSLSTSLGTTGITISTSGYGGGVGNIAVYGASISGAYGLSLLAYGGGSSSGNINFTNYSSISLANGAPLTLVAGWDGVSTSAPVVVANKGTISLTDSVASAPSVIAKSGADISLTAVTAATGMSATNDMSVSVGGVLALTGGSSAFNYARLYSNGTQSVSAASISLNAGAAAFGSAYIAAYGNQNVATTTAGGITLHGGGGSTGYGSQAFISHYEGSGDQTISLYGGTLALYGGTGAGLDSTFGGLFPGVCGTDAACSMPKSSNTAGVFSGTGNQTISFVNPGGSVVLTAGSGGIRNQASISAYGGGTQAFYGAPAISLIGGSSGGDNFVSSDGFSYLRNSAVLFAPTGPQWIEASSLTLQGNTASPAATTVGGAAVVGHGQTINVTGNVTLTGGSTGYGSSVSIYSSPIQVVNTATTTVAVYGGSQSLTAGGISIYGGAAGQNNSARISASGDQSISTGSLLLQGFGNSTAVTAGGMQQVSVTAGDIVLQGMGGQAYLSGSNQTIQAVGNLRLTGGVSVTEVYSAGTQNLTVGGISLYGGGVGLGNGSARIYTLGAQSIVTNSIFLQAGQGNYSHAYIGALGDQQVSVTSNGGITAYGAGGTGYGGQAFISHYAGTGNQAISIYGGTVALYGGSASGLDSTVGLGLPSYLCGTGADPACAIHRTSSMAGIFNALGNQTLSFTHPGASLVLVGGENGIRNNATISNTSIGTQAIYGSPAISLVGGGSGGSDLQSSDGYRYLRNGASIFSPLGPQYIEATSLSLAGNGSSIMAGVVGGASVVGNGQTIIASGNLTMMGGYGLSHNSVSISSPGNQNIVANGITMQGGADGHDNSAVITANGDQFLTLTGNTGLLLAGSGSASSYNNYAMIRHGDAVGNVGTGSGNLTITLAYGGSPVTLTGGGGSGSGGWANDSCYPASCPRSNNDARIWSGAGDLTITYAAGSGNTLTISGGGAVGDFGGNDAGISSKSSGTLTIGSSSVRPNISLTGGTAGGTMGLSNLGRPETNDNSASISTDGNIGGRVVVYGGTVTMTGGSALYGGAFIGGSNVTVNTTGNLSLTAGSSGNSSYGWVASSAAIGHDAATTINVNAGGSLALTGGMAYGSAALIGSLYSPANVTLTANGITATGNTGGVLVGSLTNATGTSVILNSGTSANVAFDAASQLRAGSLTASGKGISLLGNNDLPGTIGLTSTGANALGDITLKLGSGSIGSISGTTDVASAQTVTFYGSAFNLSTAADMEGDNLALYASSGAITFNGGSLTNAKNVTLSAAYGGIYNNYSSATAIDTSTYGGAISLSGTEVGLPDSYNLSYVGNPITVNPGSGTVTAVASSGGINLLQTAGTLTTSKYTVTNPVNNHIHLQSPNGINVDSALSVAGHDLELIATSGTISQSAPITANGLYTASYGGTTLGNTSNNVVSYSGLNSGSGAITFTNSGALTIGSSSGYGVTNSAPNNAGAYGGVFLRSMSGDLSIANSVSAYGPIQLRAGANLVQGTGQIRNDSGVGVNDISVYGGNITLTGVYSQHNVAINATGDVSLVSPYFGYVDDSYFLYNLPFTFTYYGVPYTQAYISSNGLITFGSGTASYTDSTSGLASINGIASAWNDWILRSGAGKDVFIKQPTAGALAVQWNVARYANESLTANFETILNSNGSIKFNYGAANNSFAGDVTIGLSNGSAALVSQLMNVGSFSLNNLVSTTFTPSGSSYTETVSGTNSALTNVSSGATSGAAAMSSYYSGGTVLTALNAVNIGAGGAILGSSSGVQAPTFGATAVGGINLGSSYIGTFSAANSGSGNVQLLNYASPLTIAAISNTGGGDVIVDNYGGIVVSGSVSSGGGVAMTAHSPITVNSGASVSAAGNVSLTAAATYSTSTADVLTVAGNITSTGGSVTMAGGSGVTLSPTAQVAAPLGSVSATSTYGTVAVDPAASISGASVSIPSANTSTTTAATTTAVTQTVVATIQSTSSATTSDSQSNTPVVAPATTTTSSGSMTLPGSQTIGGTAGTFGADSSSSSTSGGSSTSSTSSSSSSSTDTSGSSSTASSSSSSSSSENGEEKKEEKKEDKPKQDKTSEKKDEKSSGKKAAQCT